MRIIAFCFALILLYSCREDPSTQYSFDISEVDIHVEDVDNFMKAYQTISTTLDTSKHYMILDKLFLDKASKGQLRMMKARNYKREEYLSAIKERQSFWQSMRPHFDQADKQIDLMKAGIKGLQEIYPDLTKSDVYFTIGVHRSPGTGVDSMVLIGSEYALGDSTVSVEQLPEHNQGYYKINPIDHLQFLAVHEYVHTQQKPMVHNLLSLSLYEGIPDFVASIATGKKSPFKAPDYGQRNMEKVRAKFEQDMFNPSSIYSWLWNSSNNEFETRDLGYYIGAAIAKLHYDKSEDKQQAIKELIELDFSDTLALPALVDGSGYFTASLADIEQRYEQNRPRVVRMEPDLNSSSDITKGTKRVTLYFSEPMDITTRGFDFGPLGAEAVLRVEKVIGFSPDSMSFTFETKVLPGRAYQSYATRRFRSVKGYPIKPFLMSFETGK